MYDTPRIIPFIRQDFILLSTEDDLKDIGYGTSELCPFILTPAHQYTLPSGPAHSPASPIEPKSDSSL